MWEYFDSKSIGLSTGFKARKNTKHNLMKVLSLDIWENSTLLIEIKKWETGLLGGWWDHVSPFQTRHSRRCYQSAVKYMDWESLGGIGWKQNLEKLT